MHSKKIYISAILALLFFSSGILYQSYNDDNHKKAGYAKQISEYLHQQEKEVLQFVQNLPFIKRQVLQIRGVSEAEDLELLKELEKKDYTILIFEGKDLIFWTNNKVAVAYEDLRKNLAEVAFTSINNGKYEVIKKPITVQGVDFEIAALIPLKYNYTISSNYLVDHFTASTEKEIPPILELSKKPSEFVIKSNISDNTVYLSGDEKLSAYHHQQTLFILYILGSLFFMAVIYFTSKWIMLKKNPTIGALFLIGSIFLFRFLTLFYNCSEMFSAIPLFSKEIYAPLSSPTIGDFLINVVILLSIIYFFYREFHIRSFNHLSFKKKVVLTVVNFFSVILSLFLVISVIKYLILNTGINYNFSNIFNLNIESKTAVLGIILMITALFLFNQRMMHTITNVNIGKYPRLLCLGGALILSLPMIYQLDFMMPPIQIILVTIMYVVLFDLFTDYKRINLTWLVLWLVIYSAITSGFIFKYNNDKDVDLRKDYAYKLAEKRDTIAEKQINNFVATLKRQKYFRTIAANPAARMEAARDQIDKQFSDHSYLFNNYNYQEYWDLDEKIGSYPIGAIHKFEESDIIAEYKNIRLHLDEGKLEYLAEIDIPVIRDNQNKKQRLYIELKEKQRDKTKVYTELLLNNVYKDLKYLSLYDYSKYSNGKLIRDGDNTPYERLRIPKPGSWRVDTYGDKSEFVYQDWDNVVVVLGKEAEGRIRLISLFCFIFALLVCFAILIGLFNTFINFLPSNFTFSIYRKPSLRNRIQLSVIALIVASFFVLGLVTVRYFSNEKADYHDNRLSRKAGSVITLAEQKLNDVGIDQLEFEEYVSDISEVSNMDINMFDLNGRLQSSSEADIFNKGIVGSNMNPVAFHELKISGKERFTQDAEMIGTLPYKAMYLPIKDKLGNAQFYFGLPYYDKQEDLRKDVNDFMGMLLNVYVFLLLIAGSIAILIANSITQPISKIGEKLKQFKLGGQNEPLEWNSKDELGALIDEYNSLIQKVKDSASMLAKSEREGAWREMAKQVAHEIKNPLTPMKLSIQYLQRAYKAGASPEDLGDLIKRVTSTLIEQIDNLAAIATEFSTFAKMPQAKNQQLSVNHLVSSVYELFRERGGNMDVSINMIDKDLQVIADKNHLLRVLNNLLKNAIQAIPEDRHGIISMELRKEENNALIVVTDNGSGISEEKRDKVFVPNFTTKSSGTGLGLAMSKNIIESFYGSIYFETEVNVGTSFFVKLPIEEIKEIEPNTELVESKY